MEAMVEMIDGEKQGRAELGQHHATEPGPRPRPVEHGCLDLAAPGPSWRAASKITIEKPTPFHTPTSITEGSAHVVLSRKSMFGQANRWSGCGG